jgi:hypothetical protein
MGVRREDVCQKRPTIVSKETYYSTMGVRRQYVKDVGIVAERA